MGVGAYTGIPKIYGFNEVTESEDNKMNYMGKAIFIGLCYMGVQIDGIDKNKNIVYIYQYLKNLLIIIKLQLLKLHKI